MSNIEFTINKHQENMLKSNTVRLESNFIGRTDNSIGTGIVYKTFDNNNIHYIFTALHCLYGERQGNTFKQESDFESVQIFRQLEDGTYDEFNVSKEHVIPFYNQDLALILCDFSTSSILGLEFNDDSLSQIVLGEKFKRRYYNSYGYPKFKNSNPHDLSFKYKVSTSKTDDFTIECTTSMASENARELIAGYSGAGLFYSNKAVLIGIITQIADKNGFLSSIKVKRLNVNIINDALEKFDKNLVKLEAIDDTFKIGLKDDGTIINYEKITINKVELNIWLALKRLKQDLKDDWFQDPLNFKFLLSKKTFFNRVKKYIGEKNNYKPSSSAKHFTVPKSGFSTRPTIETSFIDRIIYQAYADKLANELDFILHRQIYSFRYNSGKNTEKYMYHYSIEQWKKYVFQTKSILNNETPYLVVADITNFFENINTKLLLDYLRSLVHDYIDTEIDNQLYNVIDSVGELITKWNDKQVNSEFGIPQNRDASSFLANLYLNKIDQIMIYSNGHEFYYRYMDDIRIVCKTKAEAIKAIYDLSVALRELGLNLNSSKTTILDFNDSNDSDKINEYLPDSLIQIEQINSLLLTKRLRDVQIAVHMTYNLFLDSVQKNIDNEDKFIQKRKIAFCINKLQLFARTKVIKDSIDFRKIIDFVLKELENQPWLTSSFIKLLMSVDESYFKPSDFEEIKKIIQDNLKNIYESQTYFLWLFLSFRKHDDKELIKIAIDNIKSTNQINQANTAGSYIYLASINWRNYKQVMLSAFNKGNVSGNYFLQRNALIALRNVKPNELNKDIIIKDLEDLHEKLYLEQKNEFVSSLPQLKISDIITNTSPLISL